MHRYPSWDNPISLPHFSARLAPLSPSSLFPLFPPLSPASCQCEVGSVPIIQTEALIDGDCGDCLSRRSLILLSQTGNGRTKRREDSEKMVGGSGGMQDGARREISNTAIYSPRVLRVSLHPVRPLRSISRSEFAECPWLEPVHPVF